MTPNLKRHRRGFAVSLTTLAASLLLAAALALGMHGVRAQGDGGAAAHPAHIHLGTCDALDPNPTFMLSDVAVAPTDADAGDAAAIPVARSVTTVEAALEDLRTGGYAINVHESVDDIGTYIACGAIAGSPEGGRLEIELDELNGSGYSGAAMLESVGDETTVEIRLERPSEHDGPGTPPVTPQSAQAALTVDVRDFAYDPDPVTVPAGGSVTWTNSDPVPHTATARDREVLQTGTIRSGESVTVTFAAAGEYEYFCEFHSGMKGTLVVE